MEGTPVLLNDCLADINLENVGLERLLLVLGIK
jgi:hypothetical protein